MRNVSASVRSDIWRIHRNGKSTSSIRSAMPRAIRPRLGPRARQLLNLDPLPDDLQDAHAHREGGEEHDDDDRNGELVRGVLKGVIIRILINPFDSDGRDTAHLDEGVAGRLLAGHKRDD